MSVLVSIATAAALLIVMAGLGRPVISRLGPNLTSMEQAVFAPLIGALPLGAAVWIVGSFNYCRISMLVVLAISGLFAIPMVLQWRVGAARDVCLQKLECLPPLARFLFLAIVTVLLISVVSSFAPPSDHDTVRYHLALPKRDLEYGRIAVQFGWSVYEFFPPLIGMLTRLSFAVGGDIASQLLNVCFSAIAAGSGGVLAMRLGGSAIAGLVAALIYLLHRVVINLAPAVTDDIALTGFVASGVCLTIAVWADRGAGVKGGVLLGLVLGGILNIKFHGFLVTALLFAGGASIWLANRRSMRPLVVAGLVAAALAMPFLVRNVLVTGNPMFPLFNDYFVADGVDIFAAFSAVIAESYDIPGGLLLAPLTMFVLQIKFDGLQYGFPVVLIALPFAFMGLQDRPKRISVLGLVFAYLVAWWFLMPHLLRFTQPILGILAALAAIGLVEIASKTQRQTWSRIAFGIFLGLAVLTQSLFVGSSALYRVPAAVGLISEREFLEGPEFRNYSLIASCRWLSERLGSNEGYLALVNDPSYHCPQAAAMQVLQPEEVQSYYTISGPPELSDDEIAGRMERHNVRYVLVAWNLGADSDPLVFAKHRFDRQVSRASRGLTPVFRSSISNVYDGRGVIDALRRSPG